MRDLADVELVPAPLAYRLFDCLRACAADLSDPAGQRGPSDFLRVLERN